MRTKLLNVLSYFMFTLCVVGISYGVVTNQYETMELLTNAVFLLVIITLVFFGGKIK